MGKKGGGAREKGQEVSAEKGEGSMGDLQHTDEWFR